MGERATPKLNFIMDATLQYHRMWLCYHWTIDPHLSCLALLLLSCCLTQLEHGIDGTEHEEHDQGRRDGPICKCLFVCFACHAPPGFLSFRLFNQSISFSLPIFLQSNEEVLVVEPQSIYLFHRRENELDKHMCIVETHARKHPFIGDSLRSSWWLRQMGSFGKFRFGWFYKGVIMEECWSYH